MIEIKNETVKKLDMIDDKTIISKNIKLILTIRTILIIFTLFLNFFPFLQKLTVFAIGKEDTIEGVMNFARPIASLVLLFITILMLVTLIKGRSEIKYYRVLISIAIINIIAIFLFMIHVFLVFLSFYSKTIDEFIDKFKKIDKTDFFPIIYFDDCCLIVYKFCFQWLTLIIFNDIVFPILLIFLLQNIKDRLFYSKLLLLILFIVEVTLACISFAIDIKNRIRQ